MCAVVGKERTDVSVMREVALAGARDLKFYPWLRVLLQQEHADTRSSGMDRTEKAGRTGADDCNVILFHGSPFPEYLF
jgi:hypothetical protein